MDEVFAELKSSFLELPRGEGFVDYATFERGYQALKRASRDDADITTASVEAAVSEAPISLIVFRSILGFTPPEWAYITTESTGVAVDQGTARAIDRNVQLKPLTPRLFGETLTDTRIRAMIEAGVKVLLDGAKDAGQGLLHRRIPRKACGACSRWPISECPIRSCSTSGFLGVPSRRTETRSASSWARLSNPRSKMF